MNAGSKALVIGATGFIGGAVAECLKQAGYEVWGLCRSASALEKLEQGGLQSLEGEVEQLAVQAKSLSTFDVVVYAASLVGEGAFETECRAIKVILQALALRRGALVYTSGALVYGDTGRQPVSETASTDNVHSLVAGREVLEREALAGLRHGIKVSVIRPSWVYGNGGYLLGFLRSARRKGYVDIFGDGKNMWSLVHVADLAELYLKCIETSGGAGIVNASAGQNVSYGEIMSLIASIADVPIRQTEKSDGYYRLGLFADALTINQVISSNYARTKLGWQPRCPDLEKQLRLYQSL